MCCCNVPPPVQIKFFRADARAIKRRIAALMDKYVLCVCVLAARMVYVGFTGILNVVALVLFTQVHSARGPIQL
jgi:hypothetical protein